MTDDSMVDGQDGTARRRPWSRPRQARGIGNTGFADANAAGKITWMSLLMTWVLTGAAPWFCPLTNLVGPYGMTWPANVELSNALMILARSGPPGGSARLAPPARSSASASSSTQE